MVSIITSSYSLSYPLQGRISSFWPRHILRRKCPPSGYILHRQIRYDSCRLQWTRDWLTRRLHSRRQTEQRVSSSLPPSFSYRYQINFAFASALNPEGKATDEIGKHIWKHGDACKDIAFKVNDCRAIYQKAVERGAVSVMEPKEMKDENGSILMATIHAVSLFFSHIFSDVCSLETRLIRSSNVWTITAPFYQDSVLTLRRIPSPNWRKSIHPLVLVILCRPSTFLLIKHHNLIDERHHWSLKIILIRIIMFLYEDVITDEICTDHPSDWSSSTTSCLTTPINRWRPSFSGTRRSSAGTGSGLWTTSRFTLSTLLSGMSISSSFIKNDCL